MSKTFRFLALGVLMSLILAEVVQAHEGHADGEHAGFNWSEILSDGRVDPWSESIVEDDFELTARGQNFRPSACKAASAAQKSQVALGNTKKDRFLRDCATTTNSSPWCSQLVRPNPDSRSTFACTYGSGQVHQLIHPDEGTWAYAFRAVRLIEELEQKGVKVCRIYNWWRPEPYNANVGGAAGRHPYGTSVDVQFCTKADQEKAFNLLCAYRRAGKLRAVGYYSSTSLHFGVGDASANTWGKSCPGA